MKNISTKYNKQIPHSDRNANLFFSCSAPLLKAQVHYMQKMKPVFFTL